jgi:DNA segregation ATPase FtsK/SpoIIIE-like protein
MLIAGAPGAGKTVLARTMALSLAMLNRQWRVQLVLIDPGGQGFAALASGGVCWRSGGRLNLAEKERAA